MFLKQLAKCSLASVLVGAIGCTWVKPVDGVEAVALVKADVVQNCQKLGKTTAQVQQKLGFIQRNEEKVAKELRTLARNQAVNEGADTIVADTAVVDGRQTFMMYKCR